MKQLCAFACLFLLFQTASTAQLINGQYGYWDKNPWSQSPSILTTAGVYGAILDPGCGDRPNLADQIQQVGAPRIQVIYQHYGKLDKNPLGYKVLTAKNSFAGAPGWRYQGACTLAFRFETQKLEFSNEARRNYNKAYKTTDYIVVFNFAGRTVRYTFGAP